MPAVGFFSIRSAQPIIKLCATCIVVVEVNLEHAALSRTMLTAGCCLKARIAYHSTDFTSLNTKRRWPRFYFFSLSIKVIYLCRRYKSQKLVLLQLDELGTNTSILCSQKKVHMIFLTNAFLSVHNSINR